jgi:hypothetical protein
MDGSSDHGGHPHDRNAAIIVAAQPLGWLSRLACSKGLMTWNRLSRKDSRRVVVIHSRKQHELEVTHVRMCPDPAAEFESGHAGHHEIDKRDLRPFHIEQRHRSLRIRRDNDGIGMAQDDAYNSRAGCHRRRLT